MQLQALFCCSLHATTRQREVGWIAPEMKYERRTATRSSRCTHLSHTTLASSGSSRVLPSAAVPRSCRRHPCLLRLGRSLRRWHETNDVFEPARQGGVRPRERQTRCVRVDTVCAPLRRPSLAVLAFARCSQWGCVAHAAALGVRSPWKQHDQTNERGAAASQRHRTPQMEHATTAAVGFARLLLSHPSRPVAVALSTARLSGWLAAASPDWAEAPREGVRREPRTTRTEQPGTRALAAHPSPVARASCNSHLSGESITAASARRADHEQ
jgi:hypothetical protein